MQHTPWVVFPCGYISTEYLPVWANLAHHPARFSQFSYIIQVNTQDKSTEPENTQDGSTPDVNAHTKNIQDEIPTTKYPR